MDFVPGFDGEICELQHVDMCPGGFALELAILNHAGALQPEVAHSKMKTCIQACPVNTSHMHAVRNKQASTGYTAAEREIDSAFGDQKLTRSATTAFAAQMLVREQLLSCHVRASKG